MRILVVLILVGQCFLLNGQWFDIKDRLEGQAWPSEVKEDYDRLPLRAKANVSPRVWSLSKQGAGLMFRFRSNSPKIVVRYQVKDTRYGMEHMPATGKSGVDLYAIDSDGQELWCAAKRSFKDTILYSYDLLDPNGKYHDLGREYRLYLPLYNQIEWMEVGTEEGSYFEALSARTEKPIVVYGTSITQGACASRPGMAWTAQVSRKLDRPLINLGFSGNGLLAPAVLDLLKEIDAKIYILDCLPNLQKRRWADLGWDNEQDFQQHIVDAVKRIREQRKETPILLVEHAGYTEAGVSSARKEVFSVINEVQKSAFLELQKGGVANVHYLTKDEIGLSLDAMVDGVHPTDMGMNEYAVAYENKLRQILKEKKGIVSTSIPVTQSREPHNYDWEKRHLEILVMNRVNAPKQMILANSIVHFWGGEPSAKIARDPTSWDSFFTPLGLRNMAYGWDRIENVLWRVHHGELDGFDADRIMVMIGTNNIHLNTDEEILEGLAILMEAIAVRQPKADLVLMGLLPRTGYETRIQQLNFEIARLAERMRLQYAYLGENLVDEKGQLKEYLFSDGLHPNKEGYEKMRPQLLKLLEVNSKE